MIITDLQSMLDMMDNALVDEIKAQKQQKSPKVVAINGKLLEQKSIHYLYTFSLQEPWEPQDETPLTVHMPTERVKATLVNSRGLIITIATEKLLPSEALQRVELFDDSSKLLENLREALKHSEEGTTQLGSKSFGIMPFVKGRYGTLRAIGTFCPDKAQAQAIQMALGSEVTYIIGPPGTGKTSTLAAIAFTYLCQGQSVLIAAPTNIAVDNAIMKLCDVCHEARSHARLQDRQIVRYGTPQHRSLIEDNRYEYVYLPKILQRYGAQLHQQREALQQEYKQIAERAEQHKEGHIRVEAALQEEYQHLHLQYNGLQQELEPLLATSKMLYAQGYYYSEQLQSTRYDLNVVRLQRNRRGAEQVELQTRKVHLIATVSKLSHMQQMNLIHRFLKGIGQKPLKMQLGEVQQEVWKTDQILANIARDLDMLYRNCSEGEHVCLKLQEQLNNNLEQQRVGEESIKRLTIRMEEYEKRMYEIYGQFQRNGQQKDPGHNRMEYATNAIEAKIADIDRQIAELEKSIVEKANVVATTLSHVYMSPLLLKRRFDVVILDEASMALLPAMYLAASHANVSVVVIGDPHQLPPIVKADSSLAAQEWLGRDLFWHNEITLSTVTQEGANSKNSVLLNEQSRMHPTISRIASQRVYEGRVVDSPRLSRRDTSYLNIAPLPGKSLMLCDTSDGYPTITRGKNGRSRMNLYHALCDIALAQQIFASLPLTNSQEGTEPRIGIVTPYAAQAMLLQRMIRGAGLEQVMRAGTVHRFQGLEFDVVIFDTVESSPLKPVKDFTAGGFGSKAMRLMNVAITRARHKLIIVAAMSYIKSQLQPNDILYYVVEDASAAYTIKSQAVLELPLPSPDEIIRSVISGPAQHHVLQELPIFVREITFFNERSFFNQFKLDIQAAKKMIVIFSPFVGRKVEEIASLLARKLKDKVEVIVYTKPFKEMEDSFSPQWMQSLEEKLGVVRKRPGMHEKLVIIDKEIVYLGSLNVLSHRNTSEIMMRVKSLNFADAIERSITIDTREKSSSAQQRNVGRKGPDLKLALSLLPEATSVCEWCKSAMRARTSEKGPFYGCVNYYKVKHPGGSSVDVTVNQLNQVPQLKNKACVTCGSLTRVEKVPMQNALLVCTSCDSYQEIYFTKD